MLLFPYLVCSQIWRNLPVDGHHTLATLQKLTKTTLRVLDTWRGRLLINSWPTTAGLRMLVSNFSISSAGCHCVGLASSNKTPVSGTAFGCGLVMSCRCYIAVSGGSLLLCTTSGSGSKKWMIMVLVPQKWN
jgi:hypothetical protein